jgi:hypothetical protein
MVFVFYFNLRLTTEVTDSKRYGIDINLQIENDLGSSLHLIVVCVPWLGCAATLGLAASSS